jgi:hypothetical protein
MTNTPEVAMTVIEPGGRRWAQLLNVDWPVRNLLPLIVSRLDLPDRLNYELQHMRTGMVLGQGDTLSASGIAAGEEMQIRPVRDKLLTDLLDALYDEAVGYAAKQLWGQVESRLETIFRLDPRFPDPKGIRYATGRPTSPGSAGYSSTPVTPNAAPPPVAAAPPVYSPSTTPGVPQTATSAAKTGPSCLLIALVVAGVLVVVAIGAVFFAGRFLRDLLDGDPGGFIPPSATEPVLGTGDVQMTLRWNNAADLDLHVTDPSGEEIYFNHPTSTSGGWLDVDANGDCSGDAPVENVFWPTGGAPVGNFQVSVVYYGDCGDLEPADYELTVSINGQVVDVRSGTLTTEGESHVIGEYSR